MVLKPYKAPRNLLWAVLRLLLSNVLVREANKHLLFQMIYAVTVSQGTRNLLLICTCVIDPDHIWQWS